MHTGKKRYGAKERQTAEVQVIIMKILGITGGVGSGKSEVLQFLQEAYKAAVSPLDDVARRLQQKGQPCYERIVEVFGRDILGADRELDRGKLAGTVFSSPEKLALLNSIVHPEVRRWVEQDISQKEREGVGLYVIESALFPNVDYGDLCGEMWYIYAEEAVRCRRLAQSRGYTEERTQGMIRSQPSEAEFRRICTAVIDNSGAFEHTKKQIGELL